ncbi:hypothetical protein DKX38_026581 [Salix brachista]|uniref:peroxidase n=1 Tax=Salix brachista TaxID=2182728 RepID=A0A5N5JF58_9ROSI|nr:hypothetical protein DKX38_026581 [Salix brachista]
MRGSGYFVVMFFCFLAFMGSTEGKLQMGFYSRSCPNAEKIVQDNVNSNIHNAPSLAASILRMHFHDCFVRVCVSSLSSYSLAHWHTLPELATKDKKSFDPGTAKLWRSEDEQRGEPDGEDDRGGRFVVGEADGNKGKRNSKGNQMRVAAVGVTALTMRGTGEGNVRQKREVCCGQG